MRLLLRGAFVALCLAPLALGALSSRWTKRVTEPRSADVAANEVPTQAHVWPASVDSAVIHVVKRAPFRADRRPPLVAFQTQEVAPPVAAPQPRPSLLLKGILWGRDPLVLLDGLPDGAPQRLLRVGDTVGGLRVHKISPTSAVIKGRDTTWVLVLQRPDQ